MKNNSILNNDISNKIKTHYRSRIVRNKNLKKSFSINGNQKENILNRNKYNRNEIKRYINTNNSYLSSRSDYNYKKNYPNYDRKYPFDLNKNASANNFYNKNDIQKTPFTRNNNKLNTLYKRKKRNSSVKNNEDNKSQKYFYKLICNNCYNNKIVTENIKNKPLEKKDLLNKTFNKINPFYFQDKMNDIEDKKNDKIKELEKLQKQALDNLAKYKIANPSNKEKLQKTNEYSINPLNSCEKEDPRLVKTMKNYDKKENFINKNKDLYRIDKPRKAINDYYNKCLYQVPVMEEEYHVNPEYKKEVNKELKKQIEENKNNKKKKKDEEINEEKIANKKMNDYIEFLNKKNREDKQKK
jgi:hypothetical protein